ncbi:MAG TPA: MoxR family ATPase [Nitrospiria bacterium]|jgi:MoxR-like ATPase|nr:MoxR family ATPase [Nitrospiria bacterium]
MDAQKLIQDLKSNIEKVIRGKEEPIMLAITTLLARGHLLIEDVPGLGKTTLAYSLAKSLGCSFKRIQFTSDLLPSDILGVTIYNPQRHDFEFRPGPIFANILLADEINRTTPKTQSSLLEAMNDAQVSVDNKTYSLPRPFMVIATQNPMEYQGTYPLPESQLDRFMLRIRMGYPSIADEKRILASQRIESLADGLQPVLSAHDVLALQEKVTTVKVDESITDYLLAIVQSTRTSELLDLGVSTRGGIFLYRVAQALAFVEGRDYCLPDDIKRLVIPVFAHRVVVNSRLEVLGSEQSNAEGILTELLEGIPVPL